MRTLACSAITTAVIATSFAIAAPASAAVLGFDNVDLRGGPVTFQLTPTASFTFAFDSAAAARFDPDTYSVRTTGNARTTAFGGFLGIPLEPSVFRTDTNIIVNNSIFPGFGGPFTTLTPIPNSLVASDLGLRYSIGSDNFFGFARLNGNGTLDIAFETTANLGVRFGTDVTGPLQQVAAIPEPATWAMMIAGFGLVGSAVRRRRMVSAAA